jgi:hypothetical protein
VLAGDMEFVFILAKYNNSFAPNDPTGLTPDKVNGTAVWQYLNGVGYALSNM